MGQPRNLTRSRRPFLVAGEIPFLVLAVLWLAIPCSAGELENCQDLYKAGKYEDCLKRTGDAVLTGVADESWWQLRLRCLLTLGRYEEAQEDLLDALNRFRASVHLRFLAYDIFRFNARPDSAKQAINEISQLVGRTPWRYSDAPHLVTLGRAALLMGADPRQVLEVFYDKAKKDNPGLLAVYQASGELALEKHDYAVAAKSFRDGLKQYPDNPELLFGLARSYANSSAEQATLALQKTLEHNPRHLPALLFQAEHALDRERYDEAHALLHQVLAVNPGHWEAWSHLAVSAHLQGDYELEEICRQNANCHFPDNARVPHLIGRKLSQHYRFAEGARYQREAIALDGEFLRPKIQLSQDLLRLGQDDEGWKLAAQVHELDGYDVVTFNLITLHDSLSKFQTLENDHFIVRMDRREAAVYGQPVLDLLERARETLCQKYGLKLRQKVTVEIFPQQKDFAIRTFGMPGGAGFLGVCFGKLITANSPASQGGNPSNWQSVLWHEFCHVVTLELTQNRMPRWLSEGISVYEERQANASWGQGMTPNYRQMVLGEDLVPVSQLSGAFLSPKTPLHLQFAYYESSLVVEHFIDTLGIDALKRLLRDLGAGMPINEALERHTGSLEAFELAFEKFARDRANSLAPELTWERDSLPAAAARNSKLAAEWLAEHPDNFWGQLALARALATEGKFDDARPVLEKMVRAYPNCAGAGPYELLSVVYRKLEEPRREREVLEVLARDSADAVDAYLRLAELAAAEKQWTQVMGYAQQYLAVNPLIVAPHRYLAQAAEAAGDVDTAVLAYRTMLLLEPADPAEVHFRLARLLNSRGNPAAYRHVLMALEEAPRYRDAHALLLAIKKSHGDTLPPGGTPDTEITIREPAEEDKQPLVPRSAPAVPAEEASR